MTKIFIVEDDEIIVKAIKIALEKEFQVICILNNNCPGVALRAIGTIPKISNSE